MPEEAALAAAGVQCSAAATAAATIHTQQQTRSTRGEGEAASSRQASWQWRAAVFARQAARVDATHSAFMRERLAALAMAELEFEAPLAQVEEADDCISTGDYPFKNINGNDIRLNNINNIKSELVKTTTNSNKINDNDIANPKLVKFKRGLIKTGEGDNFTETFSGSLEDLVNTFDDKITKCFGNYEENVENLAPVQVRTQEEIMNECQ